MNTKCPLCYTSQRTSVLYKCDRCIQRFHSHFDEQRLKIIYYEYWSYLVSRSISLYLDLSSLRPGGSNNLSDNNSSHLHFGEQTIYDPVLNALVESNREVDSPSYSHLYPLNRDHITLLSFFLSSNCLITTLNISSLSLPPDSMIPLSRLLSKTNSITSLNVSHNPLGNEGVKYISEALRINSSITILRLVDTRIGAKGMNHLSDTLKHENRTLTELWIGKNPLGDEGLLTLSNCLEKNPTIQVLNVENTGGGEKGMIHISRMLENNSQLLDLILDGNTMGEEGVRMIARSVRKNEKLGWLSIRRVGEISEKESIDEWRETVSKNKSLRTLGLGENGIDEEAKRRIEERRRGMLEILWF